MYNTQRIIQFPIKYINKRKSGDKNEIWSAVVILSIFPHIPGQQLRVTT